MVLDCKLAGADLDSSAIDEIMLSYLKFLTSKLKLPTLNTRSSFLHPCDFKQMAEIVTKQQNYLSFD